MAKIKSYKDFSENVKSFDEDMWHLCPGAEEWTLKDGTVVDPFYRMYGEYFVLGTKYGVFFGGRTDEVVLIDCYNSRTTPTSIKRILECLPATLEELIKEYPAIAATL
jgi:hypothetical protein